MLVATNLAPMGGRAPCISDDTSGGVRLYVEGNELKAELVTVGGVAATTGKGFIVVGESALQPAAARNAAAAETSLLAEFEAINFTNPYAYPISFLVHSRIEQMFRDGGTGNLSVSLRTRVQTFNAAGTGVTDQTLDELDFADTPVTNSIPCSVGPFILPASGRFTVRLATVYTATANSFVGQNVVSARAIGIPT